MLQKHPSSKTTVLGCIIVVLSCLVFSSVTQLKFINWTYVWCSAVAMNWLRRPSCRPASRLRIARPSAQWVAVVFHILLSSLCYIFTGVPMSLPLCIFHMFLNVYAFYNVLLISFQVMFSWHFAALLLSYHLCFGRSYPRD